MSVLAKFQGTLSADEFLATLEEKIEAHHPRLQSLILDREEREMSRRLREEQDSAYERSLAADRKREVEREERQRLANLEEEQRLREEEKSLQEELRKERAKELAAQWRRWRAQEIRDSQINESGDSGSRKTARVGLRLLSGERVVQKFDAQDSIESIYAFVECYDLLKQEPDELDDNSKPDNYEHSYNFQLISPLPRKVLDPLSHRKIEEEEAIWPNGSLVVELEDEDDN
jgi:FAS-associated factor 2